MGGNVYEWVFDWYGKEYYGRSPAKNPKGPLKGKYKVMRGGSWINYPVGTRPTDRTDAKPGKRLNFAGFRCVKAYSDFKFPAHLKPVPSALSWK